MEHQRESRKRLRPWLERMINSGECPGLVWDNVQERTFKIPWRHFNNRDWVSRDSQVFKEWAKYTGRYQEGDEPEYPVWKTRLRCALKKIPEIKELPEKHKMEDPNPYRVYQFIDLPANPRTDSASKEDTDGGISPASSMSVYSGSPYPRDLLEDSQTPPPPNFLEEKFPGPNQLNNVPTVVYDHDSSSVNGYNNLAKEGNSCFLQHLVPVTPQAPQARPVPNGTTTAVSELTGYDNYNIPMGGDFMLQTPSSSQNFSTTNMVMMDGAGKPLTLPKELGEIKIELTQPESGSMKSSLPSDLMSLDSGDLYRPDLPPPLEIISTGLSMQDQRNFATNPAFPQSRTVEHAMFVQLFYCSDNEMLKETVDEKGCRLFFGEKHVSLGDTMIEERMYGPKNVKQIKMPPAEACQLITQDQEAYIKELLCSSERGLILTMKDGDIYAQRLCRTRVFVSDGVAQSQLLDRKNDQPTKVFDFRGAFTDAVEKYYRKENTDIPKPYFYLTFGQEIKQSHHNPLVRLLIHVKVQHKEAARIVTELPDMPSQSFFPLVSSCDSHDQLLNRFKNMSVQN